MGSPADVALEHAVDHVRREVYLEQRAHVDHLESVGNVAIAFGVSAVLWHQVPQPLLVVWGALLLAGTFGWSSVFITPDETRPFRRLARNVWIWGSTILWAALPWLSPSAAEDPMVAWVLVFVVVFGVGCDVVFIPQTFDSSLNQIVVGYSSSYLAVLVLAGQYAAAVAVMGFVISLLLGARGWQQLVTNLIDKRVESEMTSLVDGLTGVGTRAAAVAAIEQMRADGAEWIHCMFFDVDDFKQLNDTYGYDTGDQALITIASHLRDHLPESWLLARFGGDEFVGVGTTPAELGSLFDIEIPLPDDFGGTSQAQPLSIGATVLPGSTAEPSVLFREAGAAVRKAKQTGKHAAVVMDPTMREAESARTVLGSRLSSALEDAEIIAYGQTVNDLRTGRIVGVELLARWPQSDGSMVMPNDFVPLIEEQGRGPQLGRLMIRNAIDLLSECRQHWFDVFVSVNLSARHLFHRRLPHEIGRDLSDCGISPKNLVLEITESQHLPSSNIWQTTATQLRRLGVGLAIDDFGTGYSSMEQLLSMPFSHLKLDRIITSSLDRPGTLDLAAAIGAMAQGAGMHAIAEGIETEEERKQMLNAGYIYGQGYHFSRPMPLDQIIDSLTADRDEIRQIS